MTGTLPTLKVSNPPCPVCFEKTESETGGYHCADCEIWWDRSGENPEYFDPGAGQCRSTYSRESGGLSLETETFRCMRNTTTTRRSSPTLSESTAPFPRRRWRKTSRRPSLRPSPKSTG